MADDAIVKDMIHVLAELRPFLNPDSDLKEVAEAEQYVEQDEAERAEAVDRIQDELRALSRTLDLARQAAQRPASQPTAHEHESTIAHLEDEQITLGKTANDEELGVARKEAELKRLKEELAELEAWDVGRDAEPHLGGELLRLRIINQVGFYLAPAGENAASEQIMIRKDDNADVHLVSLDEDRGSRYHLANKIWTIASE